MITVIEVCGECPHLIPKLGDKTAKCKRLGDDVDLDFDVTKGLYPSCPMQELFIYHDEYSANRKL